jgi:hypothetical protein
MAKERPTLMLTGERLMEIRSGFFALKEKRLPNGDTEALVASQYQLIRPSVDAYLETLKSIEKDAEAAERLEDMDEQKAELERCQARLAELNAHRYEVLAPRSRLTRSHLPRAHKGERGEMNPAANAGIMIALGEEFFVMPTEPEPVDGDTTGQEE